MNKYNRQCLEFFYRRLGRLGHYVGPHTMSHRSGYLRHPQRVPTPPATGRATCTTTLSHRGGPCCRSVPNHAGESWPLRHPHWIPMPCVGLPHRPPLFRPPTPSSGARQGSQHRRARPDRAAPVWPLHRSVELPPRCNPSASLTTGRGFDRVAAPTSVARWDDVE